MASPTVPWGIPLFDDSTPFAPIQAPFNSQSAALNVALTNNVAGRIGSDSARNAAFPFPEQGHRVWRTDKGWEEAYYDSYSPSTNPGGATPAGWYPVSGAIFGAAVRSAVGYNITTAEAVVGTSVTMTVESSVGIPFADGWVVPVTGIYEVMAFWRGGGAIDAYIGFGTGSSADAAWMVDNYYGSKLSIMKKFTAGATVKMFARASTLTGWDATQANGSFSIRWAGVAR